MQAGLRARPVLNTIAVCLLSAVLVLSLRRLVVAFRDRGELDAQSAVRWATIALVLTVGVALAELSIVYVERARSEPAGSALYEGLRAAKNLCAPPLGVSGALLYLSRMLRSAARARRS
jgi:hypothetical protein